MRIVKGWLKIKSGRTAEILLKIREIYKKGGIFSVAKTLIKIEQNWLKNNKPNFQELEDIKSYNQLNISPEVNNTQSYNQLDIDSVVKQINKDTSQWNICLIYSISLQTYFN